MDVRGIVPVVIAVGVSEMKRLDYLAVIHLLGLNPNERIRDELLIELKTIYTIPQWGDKDGLTRWDSLRKQMLGFMAIRRDSQRVSRRLLSSKERSI